jgi:hypothetical protein
MISFLIAVVSLTIILCGGGTLWFFYVRSQDEDRR